MSGSSARSDPHKTKEAVDHRQNCVKVEVAVLGSPFIIGRMFLREPSWKYSAKLVGFLTGRTFLREPNWKYSSKLTRLVVSVDVKQH